MTQDIGGFHCNSQRTTVLHWQGSKDRKGTLLIAASKVVVDNLDQCASIGDLKLALKQGLMTRGDVHAELGEVIAGRKPGRENNE